MIYYVLYNKYIYILYIIYYTYIYIYMFLHKIIFFYIIYEGEEEEGEVFGGILGSLAG